LFYLKFLNNACVGKSFFNLKEALEEFENSCKRPVTIQDGKELTCERSANLTWFYGDYPMLSCCFDGATVISSNATVIKADYSTTALIFHGNKNISYLPIELYKVCPYLTIVEAMYCNIKQIGAENFRDLDNLEKIWLSGNKIEDIPGGTFKGLPALRHLDMRKFL
jgi:Leucine rich repeat